MICRCGNESSAWLCGSCADRFEGRLAEVAGVVGQVEALVPRMTLTATYGDRSPGVKAQHAPAPVAIDALSALLELRHFLLNTALRVATPTNPITGRGSGELGEFLARNIRTVASLSNAYDLATQLDKLVCQCERAGRLLEHKQFAGTCQTDGCGTDLYTGQGSNHARCGTCGAEYEAVQEWRDGAKEYARAQDDNTVGYPDALSQRLNRVHGIDIGADYIRKLASLGTLKRANPERGPDGKKLRAMYRLGDIKAILNGSREAA